MGGVPLPVDEWGIDICVTVPNKCLASLAGTAPISISQRAWDQMRRKPDRAHGWYLNLETWKEFETKWGSWHPTPTTLPTNVIYALLVSLRRIMEEGLEIRYQHHRHAAQTVRTGLRRMGFEMFTPDAYASPLLTAVRGIPGLDVEDLRQYLLEEWQVMVSGGLGELRGNVFRVAHIGRAISPEYVDQFLAGVEAYLRLQGYELPSTTGEA
jgi:alanine-glyoxylate transaminase/serine-glyoxylate transaminase/serine-pyruvate transaminase